LRNLIILTRRLRLKIIQRFNTEHKAYDFIDFG
jgi:hypothetical protein